MNLDDLKLLAQDTPVHPIHPALDVVDGVLYLTTLLPAPSGRLENMVLTSTGEIFLSHEWEEACAQRYLLPLASPVDVARCGPRWHPADAYATLKALAARSAPSTDASLPQTAGTAPRDAAAPASSGSWADAYAAITTAFDARLQLCDPDYLTVLVLFAMMSYVHPLFDVLPILHLLGPAESGKSRAAAALAAVAFNGVALGDPSPAIFFRAAHDGRYTQILTEADHLEQLGSGDRFARQLQSACYKTEASVDLAEGRGSRGGYARRVYYAFCPRVILSTRPFGSHPLRTRCIRLHLVRSLHPDQQRLRASLTDAAVWAPLRDRLYRLALACWADVVAARDTLQQSWIDDGAPVGRAFEKWLPLATIAQLVSPNVFAIVRRLAAEDVRDQADDALDELDLLLAYFMVWLVRDPITEADGDAGADAAAETEHTTLRLTVDELYRAFTGLDPSGLGSAGRRRCPAWAEYLGVSVTAEQLRRQVPNWRTLTAQLKRLRLLGERERARDHTRYRFRRQVVLDGVAALVRHDAVEGMLARVGPGAA